MFLKFFDRFPVRRFASVNWAIVKMVDFLAGGI
uniref:Uncharacterized protein n=1 Tax=Rhizophora mucronata TaxID=61149 RepID=A0A2P2N0N2_RHIMU